MGRLEVGSFVRGAALAGVAFVPGLSKDLPRMDVPQSPSIQSPAAQSSDANPFYHKSEKLHSPFESQGLPPLVQEWLENCGCARAQQMKDGSFFIGVSSGKEFPEMPENVAKYLKDSSPKWLDTSAEPYGEGYYYRIFLLNDKPNQPK